jgi:hypothetical protein
MESKSLLVREPEVGVVQRKTSTATLALQAASMSNIRLGRRLELFGSLAELATYQFQLFVLYLNRMGVSWSASDDAKMQEMRKEISDLEDECAELKRCNMELQSALTQEPQPEAEAMQVGENSPTSCGAILEGTFEAVRVLGSVIYGILIRVYAMVEFIVYMSMLTLISNWNVILLAIVSVLIGPLKLLNNLAGSMTKCSPYCLTPVLILLPAGYALVLYVWKMGCE